MTSVASPRGYGCLRPTSDAFGEGVERVNDILGDPRPVALPAARSFQDARLLELLDGTLRRRQRDARGSLDVPDVDRRLVEQMREQASCR